jgi:hypothetical protein
MGNGLTAVVDIFDDALSVERLEGRLRSRIAWEEKVVANLKLLDKNLHNCNEGSHE